MARHPKYLILRELGRGGMGVVYQARHREMDRQVVIKVINRSLLDRPDSLERFRREIRAAAQLSHPNIVTAYDAEQAGELHMLVMEFVPGRNLTEVVRLKGPLPISVACHFARQVAWGLQHAYERNLVHRDIKPQNLMLTPQGRVKILDFGLAKHVREERRSTALTSENAYLGTPDYCAPEQATDAGKADIRADLYDWLAKGLITCRWAERAAESLLPDKDMELLHIVQVPYFRQVAMVAAHALVFAIVTLIVLRRQGQPVKS